MTTKAQAAAQKMEEGPWSQEQIEGIHKAMQSLAEGKGISHERLSNKWKQKLEAHLGSRGR